MPDQYMSFKPYVLMMLGGITVLLLGVAIFFTAFSLENMCDNHIVNESLSPNRRFKAIVFERDCGATTGFTTQVSVIKANAKLANESGNVLVLTDNDGQAPLDADSTVKVEVRWLDGSKLLLLHHPKARSSQLVSRIENIEIQIAKADK